MASSIWDTPPTDDEKKAAGIWDAPPTLEEEHAAGPRPVAVEPPTDTELLERETTIVMRVLAREKALLMDKLNQTAE